MKRWSIICFGILFIGLAFLFGAIFGVSIYIVEEKLADFHKTNLLILYDLDKED